MEKSTSEEENALHKSSKTSIDNEATEDDEVLPKIDNKPPEENLEIETHSKKLTFLERIRLLFKYMTVEPVLFCYILPNSIEDIATQNLSLRKACLVNLNYTIEICNRIAAQDKKGIEVVEQEMQELVANMHTWLPFIRFSFPVILLLFFGPLSDHLRTRKPFILIPMLGEFISSVALLATSYFQTWPMEAAGISQFLFTALTGGHYSIMMAAYAYISDVSTIETRTFRIGIISAILSIILPVGSALSGILYLALGYYGVFFITSTIQLLGFIYAACSLTYYTVKANEERETKKESLIKIVFINNFTKIYKVVFSKRQGNDRARLILLLLVFTHICGTRTGEGGLWYLFFRLKFDWNEFTMSMYEAFWSVINLLGNTFTVVVLIKKLKLDDSTLGILACLTIVISFVVYGVVQTSLGMFLATILEIACSSPDIAVYALSSKLVNPDELGTINSVLEILESLIGMIYKPIFSNIYKATLRVYPATFILVTSACYIPSTIMFIILYRMRRKNTLTLVPTTEENAVKEEVKEENEETL